MLSCKHTHINKCVCAHTCVYMSIVCILSWSYLRSSCVMGKASQSEGCWSHSPTGFWVLPGHPGTLPTLTRRDVSVIFDWVWLYQPSDLSGPKEIKKGKVQMVTFVVKKKSVLFSQAAFQLFKFIQILFIYLPFSPLRGESSRPGRGLPLAGITVTLQVLVAEMPGLTWSEEGVDPSQEGAPRLCGMTVSHCTWFKTASKPSSQKFNSLME